MSSNSTFLGAPLTAQSSVGLGAGVQGWLSLEITAEGFSEWVRQLNRIEGFAGRTSFERAVTIGVFPADHLMKKEKVLDSNQLATVAANLLNQGILESERTSAKRIFRELEANRRVSLTTLKMEDGGTVRMDLSMDATAFNGTLNFSAWRDGVMALVAQLADDLRAEKSLPVFKPIDPPGDATEEEVGLNLIGCVGATTHDGMVNTLMLGIRPDPSRPIVTLRLVYVDPAQFASGSSSS